MMKNSKNHLIRRIFIVSLHTHRVKILCLCVFNYPKSADSQLAKLKHRERAFLGEKKKLNQIKNFVLTYLKKKCI